MMITDPHFLESVHRRLTTDLGITLCSLATRCMAEDRAKLSMLSRRGKIRKTDGQGAQSGKESKTNTFASEGGRQRGLVIVVLCSFNRVCPKWLAGSVLVLLGITLLTVAAGFPARAIEPSYLELIESANAAFQERFIKERMEEAIASYEAVLASLDLLPVQSQALVLNRLSQLHYEVTTFSDGYPPEDREHLLKGKACGLRSLRLDPNFTEWEGESFRKAVGVVTDRAALMWTTHNWGAYLAFDPVQGILSVDRIKAMYERCLAVEEGYWGASAHSALGALLVVTPEVLGGNPQQGRTHLETATALDPSYLENRVVYAQYWGFTYDFFGNVNGIRDSDLIERELNLVLEAPIGDWSFWNREAKKEAQILLRRLKEFSQR